jgi:hypothetical protein
MILYLLLDQRVQRKMHEELDKLCSEKGNPEIDPTDPAKCLRDYPITLKDRPRLPYLNAVINVTIHIFYGL